MQCTWRKTAYGLITNQLTASSTKEAGVTAWIYINLMIQSTKLEGGRQRFEAEEWGCMYMMWRQNDDRRLVTKKWKKKNPSDADALTWWTGRMANRLKTCFVADIIETTRFPYPPISSSPSPLSPSFHFLFPFFFFSHNSIKWQLVYTGFCTANIEVQVVRCTRYTALMLRLFHIIGLPLPSPPHHNPPSLSPAAPSPRVWHRLRIDTWASNGRAAARSKGGNLRSLPDATST